MPLYHSNLSLYYTPHYSAESATVAPQTIAVMHTTLFSIQCHCSRAISPCKLHHIMQQNVPMKNSYLKLYCTPNYSANYATVSQQTIAVLQSILFSRQCHSSKKTIAVLHTTLFSRESHCSQITYRCNAHEIILQTVPL